MLFAQHSLIIPRSTLLLILLFLVRCSLLNVVATFATPYSTLLAQGSLLNVVATFATPYSTLLAQGSLLNIIYSTLLVQHCHCSCWSLFDIIIVVPCLTLLIQCYLFGVICWMLLLLLVWCYFFGIPCWCWYCYSLLDVVVFFVIPYSTLLLTTPCLMLLLFYLFLV
jgi:hypothetical protein